MNAGSQDGVVAYNYYGSGTTADQRAIFWHGNLTGEILAEGNDVSYPIQLDNYWGRQGWRNTLYRNRMRGPNCSRNNGHAIWSAGIRHSDHGGDAVSPTLNVIGNTTDWLRGGPSFSCSSDDVPIRDVDLDQTDMHLEYNLATDRIALATPETTTNCGTGVGNCGVQGARPQLRGRNYSGADAAPAAWDTASIPTSLFLPSAPDWWCQEACGWSSEGIGALGDDMSGSPCMIPAQIRYEGGTCTPL